MRYYKRANELRNSTGSNVIDLETLDAYSYSWWQYMKLTKNHGLLFNFYIFSSSTSRQQRDAMSFLWENGIPFKTVYWSNGINNPVQSLRSLRYDVKELADKIRTPRTRKKTNQYRLRQIKSLRNQINFLRLFIKEENQGLNRNLKSTHAYNLSDYVYKKPDNRTKLEKFNDELKGL